MDHSTPVDVDGDEVFCAARALSQTARTVSNHCALLSRDRASVATLHERVLVVHDNAAIGDGIGEAITRVLPGLDVEVAYTYQAGIAAARARRPRVIVTDWHLDDGHTGVELRRSLGVGPRAVLVTAQDVDRPKLFRIAHDIDAKLCFIDGVSESVEAVAHTVSGLIGPTPH